MKHVFCIHSSITYLMMRGVIEHKNINPKDVIVFTRRIPPIDLNEFTTREINVPIINNNISKNIILNKLFLYMTPLRTIIWLFKMYIMLGLRRGKLYIPVSSRFEYNILSTKLLFNSLNYIEEGLLYYKKEKTIILNKTHPLQLRILYCGLLKNRNKFSDKATHSYVFSNEVVKKIPRPIILSLKNNLRYIKNFDVNKEIIIVIDSSSTWNGIITRNEHITIIKKICHRIKKLNNNYSVSFKLHPNQYIINDEADFFRSLLKEELASIKELASNTVLEAYLGNPNKIIFCGLSSLSFYAYLLNYPIKSFIFEYAKYNDSYSIAELMKIYPINYIDHLQKNIYNV